MDAPKENLSLLTPVTPISGNEKPKPGRIFRLGASLRNAGINFETSIQTMATALAILTSTKVDNQGIHHPCSCNGPHHALIVAKFSLIVLGEMLIYTETKAIIDKIISGLSLETQQFLTNDNYKNYKKIVEIMALLHDLGRPEDGRDAWSDSNNFNVIANMEYLLSTATISSHTEIMQEIKKAVESKFEGFLFGAALEAGDSLHSGNAFYGGLWNYYGDLSKFVYKPAYSPQYMRVYNDYPGFRKILNTIILEIQQFVLKPTPENGGRLAAVRNYLVNAEDWENGNGKSIIKKNFADIICNEFCNINAQKFPIMAKYLKVQMVNFIDDDEFVLMGISWKEELATIIHGYKDRLGKGSGISFFSKYNVNEISWATDAIDKALQGEQQLLCNNKEKMTAILRSGEIGDEIRSYIKKGFVPNVNTVRDLIETLVQPGVNKQENKNLF